MFASIAATPFANFSALGGSFLSVVRAAGRLYETALMTNAITNNDDRNRKTNARNYSYCSSCHGSTKNLR